jgi:hypothetical protein
MKLISEKINSWRFGLMTYFMMQCLMLVGIFVLCTSDNVSSADRFVDHKISQYVFWGTTVYQFIYVIPAALIFLIFKFKRTALSIFVGSLFWIVLFLLLMQLGKS